MAGQPRHFTDLSAVSATDLRAILDDAVVRKAAQKAGTADKPFDGKVLAMIFDKPSTRTRVSFDVAMRQLGGSTIMLTGAEMQLGRAESIADTARVLSRYVDAIMIRTTAHSRLMELAEHATVPVINGLTDDTHPCQIMADVMTFEEHRGPVKDRLIAWSGDGNNVLHSLVEGAARFGYRLNMAVPEGSEPGARPQRVPALPGQRRADGAGQARRAVHALPAGASRRGGDRRGDRRAAVGGLRRGGEPAARPEGGARLVPRRLIGAGRAPICAPSTRNARDRADPDPFRQGGAPERHSRKQNP